MTIHTAQKVNPSDGPKNSGPIRNLAIIFAMEGEAQPLISSLGLQEVDSVDAHEEFGFKAYHGRVGTLNIYISVNGKDPRHGVDNVGTEISALNAFGTIEQFQPDLLINAGTAGGFKSKGGDIGDVYFSEGAVVNHDHRIPIPGFQEYGVGSFSVLPLASLPERMGAKRGMISTGNSLDMTAPDADNISISGAVVKEMEAAAVARVAERTRTAFVAIKSITDFADQPNNHEAFQSNYALACDRLGATLRRLVDYLSEGKNLEDL